MSQENVELVRRAYAEGYAQRDVEIVRDLFDPDFRFHMRTGWPGQSVYRSEEMPRMWADVDDTYLEYVLVPREFEDAGDYVVVTLSHGTRLMGSNARIETTVWHVWHITGGVIREAWSFGQRTEAIKAAGLAE